MPNKHKRTTPHRNIVMQTYLLWLGAVYTYLLAAMELLCFNGAIHPGCHYMESMFIRKTFVHARPLSILIDRFFIFIYWKLLLITDGTILFVNFLFLFFRSFALFCSYQTSSKFDFRSLRTDDTHIDSLWLEISYISVYLPIEMHFSSSNSITF